MNKNINEIIRSKGFYIALASGICMIVVLCYTVNGIISSGNKLSSLDNTNNKQAEIEDKISSNYEIEDGVNVAQNGETTDEIIVNEETLEEKTSNIEIPKEEVSNVESINDSTISSEVSQTEEEESILQENICESNDIDCNESTEVIGYDNIISNLSFDEEIGLAWPVEGNIIMNYSADSLVYFQTLGQFRVNPAIFIEADTGTQVKSAYAGVVTEVITSKEFGNMVKVAIGNDYILTYGQLEDVKLSKGDKIKEGDVIGVVATPTGYYSGEGEHLYFKAEQAETTVDPMLLLR